MRTAALKVHFPPCIELLIRASPVPWDARAPVPGAGATAGLLRLFGLFAGPGVNAQHTTRAPIAVFSAPRHFRVLMPSSYTTAMWAKVPLQGVSHGSYTPKTAASQMSKVAVVTCGGPNVFRVSVCPCGVLVLSFFPVPAAPDFRLWIRCSSLRRCVRRARHPAAPAHDRMWCFANRSNDFYLKCPSHLVLLRRRSPPAPSLLHTLLLALLLLTILA